MPDDSQTLMEDQPSDNVTSDKYVVSHLNREGQLFGIGNPLLDITSAVTDEFLEK